MATVAERDRGRKAFRAGAWQAAYDSFAAADLVAPLAPDELELLATAAYMLGRESEYRRLLERAHRDHLARGHAKAAVRCAFWVGVNLASRGEIGRAGGWLGRARRVLDDEEGECVEHGYLLLPLVFEQKARRDLEAAAATAGEAMAISRRFDDPDLFALAAHELGHIEIRLGRVDEGLRLLDETMLAAAAGELSPVVSGIAYCGVILACQDAYDIRRAQEWTAALSDWCGRQPDLVAFTGRCLTHRAELMQLRGSLSEALAEARRAEERSTGAENTLAAGEAAYRRGEIHRLLGELESAAEAYADADRHGREPQPGLALLRLAQGRPGDAAAALRRAAAETAEPVLRARLLPALVEITLATGDVTAAHDASVELESLARSRQGSALGAMAAQARGAVRLAQGEPAAALVPLRQAGQVWLELDAPYEAARVRELVSIACRALGDGETAAQELEAARTAYEGLGAKSDLARIGPREGQVSPTHGLTPRELQVLRLVAAGKTNRAIAAELVVSDRTVDRHVSNIFTKLSVSSRAAATAVGYRLGLVGGTGR